MPYPITIFESQPFSDQCSTLITADQCLTLWYMLSHNWRSTVLSFPWSQVFCNNFPVSLRLENDALCRPHKMSNLASPDLFPAPLHFLGTRLNQLALTKFGRRFRYPIMKAIVSKRHCKREVLGTRLRSCASSIIFVKLKNIEKNF